MICLIALILTIAFPPLHAQSATSVSNGNIKLAQATCTYRGNSYGKGARICMNGKWHECGNNGWTNLGSNC
jgi:hypothetical protein